MKVALRALAMAIAAAVSIVLLTYVLKAAIDAVSGLPGISAAAGINRSQIFWVLASVGIVFVVFWSGVGAGSRYQPPAESELKAMPKKEVADVSFN
jgi:hypothetical protein